MSDPAPTSQQLKQLALRHRKLAERHPEKAATHTDIADALERQADAVESENDFAVRQQGVERLKVLIAEHEAAGRTAWWRASPDRARPYHLPEVK